MTDLENTNSYFGETGNGKGFVNMRVGRISYLNVDPIYHGLENGLKPSWVRLKAAPPSALNQLMATKKLDISPVSTGAYAKHSDQWIILPDLSVSCHGAVMSVLLASHYPINDLDGKRVLITSESGTAVLLLKLIFAIEGVRPDTVSGTINTSDQTDKRYDAVMVIGDKALSGNWGRQYKYRLDLGEVWLHLSGLPIVFAVWAVRRQFAEAHPKQVRQMATLFKKSAQMGASRLDQIITTGADRLDLKEKTVRAYFKAMKYDLDPAKQKALIGFFDALLEHRLIAKPTPLNFFK